ncbi:methyltransferase domain-containing protein [Agarilytica rhodophyticola]|uniref:methyltransferase domain-containing protein n=1 Tax=Agarilytica rhodophyticola TaxID=1737490 RepID=UPI000B349B34|nr:methyltransferase domain-containing protein [Agarilytica rhodophyticola]
MQPDDSQKADAYYNQAVEYLNSNNIDSAIKKLELVVSLTPNNFDALADLGNLLNQKERYVEAETILLKACNIDNSDASVHYCLGKALKYQNRIEKAIEHYKICCELEEHDVYLMDIAYAQITALYRQTNCKKEAKAYYQKWAKAVTNNPVPRVFLDILGKRITDQLPVGFVRQEFDYFAETFDRTLERIHYIGPQEVSKILASYIPQANSSLSVLDLGCGTGLCASILKPYSHWLCGVDLSAKMLEKAKLLNVYDELFESDAVEYLKKQTTAFDLISVADVFPYFGNIEELLSSISIALKRNGMLIFSFEELTNSLKNWSINDSGRFQHRLNYIKKYLKKNKISIISCESIGYRYEGGQPIPGVFIAAQKT